jgi:hypothetical protein
MLSSPQSLSISSCMQHQFEGMREEQADRVSVFSIFQNKQPKGFYLSSSLPPFLPVVSRDEMRLSSSLTHKRRCTRVTHVTSERRWKSLFLPHPADVMAPDLCITLRSGKQHCHCARMIAGLCHQRKESKDELEKFSRGICITYGGSGTRLSAQKL